MRKREEILTKDIIAITHKFMIIIIYYYYDNLQGYWIHSFFALNICSIDTNFLAIILWRNLI